MSTTLIAAAFPGLISLPEVRQPLRRLGYSAQVVDDPLRRVLEALPFQVTTERGSQPPEQEMV